ncbi:hypothetical protein TcYC6_0015610 [Trypanosoma cruzi]|nr:hypothetical protein TcYC6_0015610 [Trypanosoma cruzi]
MAIVVIKEPNLRKLLAEQQLLLSTLPQPPSPVSTYLTAPVAPLTSVYHSRGCVELIEDQPALLCGGGKGDDEDATNPKRPSLLFDLLNAASRVDLDMEKTLSLTCDVLSKARCRSSKLTDNAQQLLGRIMELSACFKGLSEQQSTTPSSPEK